MGKGAGGGTEKRARSWGSVSRIREVMSGVESMAFVKILGGGKLVVCMLVGHKGLVLVLSTYERVAIDSEESAICSRWRDRSAIVIIRVGCGLIGLLEVQCER